MMKLIKNALIALLLLALVTGCTSVSRGLGSITANKYAEPRSGTVWVVPPPQLEPPRQNERTVYISYRNISDAQLDLRSLLIDSAREQGWTIVDQPGQARYRLRASARYFGEVEPESGGASVGRNMGVIAGAATGVGIGAMTARATDSGIAGVVAGVGGGGLIGQGISNASRPREWALIMDVVLEERMSKAIDVEISTGSGSQAGTGGATSNSRMAAGGGTSSSNTSSATTTRKTDYFPHGVRLSVWANQMGMSEDEAWPHIEKRVRNVSTRMLPL